MQTKLFVAIAASAIALIPTPGLAKPQTPPPQWIFITDAIDGTEFFVARQSINIHSNRRTRDYLQLIDTRKSTYRSVYKNLGKAEEHVLVDCVSRTYQTLNQIFYNRNGQISSASQGGEPKPVIPGTAHAIVINTVCYAK